MWLQINHYKSANTKHEHLYEMNLSKLLIQVLLGLGEFGFLLPNRGT